jgi:hypothetical protein
MLYKITITSGNRTDETWKVNASSLYEAAYRARYRVSGSRKVFVERVTGTVGMTGVFQCYKGDGLPPAGPPYHVMPDTQ